MPRKLELRGQRFGRLTVIDKIEKKGQGYQVWRCLCDCGNETEVTEDRLVYGGYRSCGCLQREQQKKIPENSSPCGWNLRRVA